MNNSEKVQALKSLLRNDVIQTEDYHTVLEQTEILKHNYVDYVIILHSTVVLSLHSICIFEIFFC